MFTVTFGRALVVVSSDSAYESTHPMPDFRLAGLTLVVPNQCSERYILKRASDDNLLESNSVNIARRDQLAVDGELLQSGDTSRPSWPVHK